MAQRWSVVGWSSLALVCGLALVASVDARAAQDETTSWAPTSTYEGKWDWIQMTSGEWVKGEIIAMYDESIEFDSDEFDILDLDWGDIRQIHSSQIITVGLVDRRTFVGRLIVDGDAVTVIGDETHEFSKDQVLTMTAGEPRELNYWSMKVYLGWLIRSGNSDVEEVNAQINIKRRTVRDRVAIDFVGNRNVTDGVDVSDNQRASASWDRFINDRFFVTPVFGEYFRDRFQNIASRITLGAGIGYQLIDRAKLEWSVSAGPGYQETRFVDVPVDAADKENTGAFILGTEADWDITSWLEFDGSYRAQFVNELSGTYNHHLVASFETDITSLIDFDVTWIWDRIQDPRPAADGTVPERDDFRTTAGLTFEW